MENTKDTTSFCLVFLDLVLSFLILSSWFVVHFAALILHRRTENIRFECKGPLICLTAICNIVRVFMQLFAKLSPAFSYFWFNSCKTWSLDYYMTQKEKEREAFRVLSVKCLVKKWLADCSLFACFSSSILYILHTYFCPPCTAIFCIYRKLVWLTDLSFEALLFLWPFSLEWAPKYLWWYNFYFSFEGKIFCWPWPRVVQL